MIGRIDGSIRVNLVEMRRMRLRELQCNLAQYTVAMSLEDGTVLGD